jgi:hypothetical protein
MWENILFWEAPMAVLTLGEGYMLAKGLYYGIGRSFAAKGGTTAFKSFTKSNYRHNLQVLTGKSGAGMDAHHIFPQASRFQQQWNRVGLNIHSPKNLTWWQSGAHKSAAGAYNKAWDLFFEKNPQATLQQIQNFGSSLMKSHGF